MGKKITKKQINSTDNFEVKEFDKNSEENKEFLKNRKLNNER